MRLFCRAIALVVGAVVCLIVTAPTATGLLEATPTYGVMIITYGEWEPTGHAQQGSVQMPSSQPQPVQPIEEVSPKPPVSPPAPPTENTPTPQPTPAPEPPAEEPTSSPVPSPTTEPTTPSPEEVPPTEETEITP